MLVDVFSTFCETADRNGVIFYYTGSLSQNVIAIMGDALKLRLERQDAKGVISRKLFSSFIEMIQNAVQYSPEDPESGGDKIGSIAIGKQKEKYYIMCGNLTLKKDVPRIQAKLGPLKNMSAEEIKQAYKIQLKNDDHHKDATSKGAGLGFLSLARDSSEPIEYSFTDVPDHDELSTFFLKTTI